VLSYRVRGPAATIRFLLISNVSLSAPAHDVGIHRCATHSLEAAGESQEAEKFA